MDISRLIQQRFFVICYLEGYTRLGVMVRDMCVDCGRFEIFGSKQFLNSADIITRIQM